jgi:septum formation protein
MKNIPNSAMKSDSVGLVLASGSSARHRLLDAAGVAHRVIPTNLDEAAIKLRCRAARADAGACALALALAKAAAVSPRHPDAWVLGCDQLLDLGGDWLDKPETPSELRDQLTRLRGRKHTLVSALCLMRNGVADWRHLARATLTMRDFSDDFLDGYVRTVGPQVLSSVGGYSIEGEGVQLFSRIDGALDAVMGLPLLPLLARLRRLGLMPS